MVTYLCADCGRPVAPGDGHLRVIIADIRAHADAQRRHAAQRRDERRWNTGRPIPTPVAPLARWTAHHRRCEPQPAAALRGVDVGFIDTAEKLLIWVASVLSRPWLRDTDLAGFLRAAVAPRTTTPDQQQVVSSNGRQTYDIR